MLFACRAGSKFKRWSSLSMYLTVKFKVTSPYACLIQQVEGHKKKTVEVSVFSSEKGMCFSEIKGKHRSNKRTRMDVLLGSQSSNYSLQTSPKPRNVSSGQHKLCKIQEKPWKPSERASIWWIKALCSSAINLIRAAILSHFPMCTKTLSNTWDAQQGVFSFWKQLFSSIDVEENTFHKT